MAPGLPPETITLGHFIFFVCENKAFLEQQNYNQKTIIKISENIQKYNSNLNILNVLLKNRLLGTFSKEDKKFTT